MDPADPGLLDAGVTRPIHEMPNTDRLNADYMPEIELDDSSLLAIKHDGQVNREKVTASQVGNTRYYALLETVQYGKWGGEAAALLIFNFHFGFREQHHDRFTYAMIRAEFEETADSNFTKPKPRNFANDPEVKKVIPEQIYGISDPKKEKKTWNLEGSISAGIPVPGAPQLGLNPSYNAQSEYSIQHRMKILGERDGNDAHSKFNVALWETEENSLQKSGILHNWKGAVVITMPNNPEFPVKITMRIETRVKFSVNPARLLPKRDDPILLIKGVSKGKRVVPDLDFDDPKFPWSKVLKIPAEYEVGLVQKYAATILTEF